MSQIKPGSVFSNGTHTVRIAANIGVRSGLRLDQYPQNGLVYAPWFRSEQDVADFLSRGGHSSGTPFQRVNQRREE